MPINDEQFESLLEQVRGLHRRADTQITQEPSRLRANVQARLNWERNPPPLPSAQREIADEVVEILAKPRLSSSQSRALQQAFFGRRSGRARTNHASPSVDEVVYLEDLRFGGERRGT